MFPGSFYFVLLSDYGLSSMHQTMVCRRDGHNSLIARVLQAISPVLLLSDDRLVCFSLAPGSSFRLEGREGLYSNQAAGEEPRKFRKLKKRLFVIYIYISPIYPT